MKRNFMFLLLVMLVLVFSNSSWAQFPCYPGDSLATCCGADSGLSGYSRDAGICDTIYIEPWPHLDTSFVGCYGGGCDTFYTNDASKFLHINLFVTHDSNTFWNFNPPWWTWIQDSVRSFVVPLTFWHQPVSGMDADSVVFPFGTSGYQGVNNVAISPYYPWMGKSMFRHFVKGPGDTTYNRMLRMVENSKAAWNVYTDVESHSSPGDSGHVYLGATPMDPNCQAWWEGSRVLLATLTFKVYMSDADTTEICFDTAFWPPASSFSFTRYDALVYYPRHRLPIRCKVYDDTVEIIYSDVRWIEDFTDEEESRPTSFSVSQNYPNPFNPVTNFKFTLPQASHVKIEIFNILGQNVKTLVDKDMRAGVYLVDWDGMDERGVRASSGVYFYRIVAGEFSDIRKMVLLK